jgi:Ca2+/Na+ antiporter
MTRSLRSQIIERERAQHQIAILSGGTIAAAASILARSHVSVWVILGLSILLLAFAFTMLNNDYRIIAAATFIASQDDQDGHAQRAWERHLRQESRRSENGIGHIVLLLRVVAAYAVPILGSLGVITVYLVRASGYQLAAALVPLILCCLLGLEQST